MVSLNKDRLFFSSISFVRISYKTIWLKTWSWYKTHWKWNLEGLKSLFSKIMRIKNLRGSEVRLKKSKFESKLSFTLETSKNQPFFRWANRDSWAVLIYPNFSRKRDRGLSGLFAGPNSVCEQGQLVVTLVFRTFFIQVWNLTRNYEFWFFVFFPKID